MTTLSNEELAGLDADGERLFLDEDNDACLNPAGREDNLVALAAQHLHGGPLNEYAWQEMVRRFNAAPDLAAEVLRLRADKDILQDDLRRAADRYENRTPTEWAYNAACAALEKHRQRADQAEARERALLDSNEANRKRMAALNDEMARVRAENAKLREAGEAKLERLDVGHEWVPSQVGHGEAQCKWCYITNREAWAIGVKDSPCERRLKEREKAALTTWTEYTGKGE